jgi:hypothetical protein
MERFLDGRARDERARVAHTGFAALTPRPGGTKTYFASFWLAASARGPTTLSRWLSWPTRMP